MRESRRGEPVPSSARLPEGHLVATCEANDVNPEEYLADVLLRVQTPPQAHIGELRPHDWKRLRAADSS